MVRVVGGALHVVAQGAAPALSSFTARWTRELSPILQSELQRNFQALKKQDAPAYFMSYTMHDTRSTRLGASFGALGAERRIPQPLRHRGSARRRLRARQHASDPRRHEGHGSAGRARIALPLTDDETPIRLALWRATDRTFKQASEALTRVKTNVAAKVKEEDPAPDFSREDPQTYTSDPVSYTLDTKAWEARLRRISAPFADDPLVFRSDVSLSVESDNRYYINSEGAQVVTGEVACRLFIQAVTKADDGMELPLYSSYFASSPSGLPDEKQLIADARNMIDLLSRLRKAPLVDPYSGPAILSGRAAGVFFHEIFGHRVEANRQRNADDGQTFGSRIGQPVLPSFLSVTFDPTLKKLGNIELMGHYLYDDEGVKARRVTVVDKGVLKTFLVDRAPLRGFARSNGHGRAEPGYVPVSRQSNLTVESSHSVSTEKLLDMLRGRSAQAGQAVRPAVRQHRRRFHQHGPRIGQRLQRAAERRVQDLHRRVPAAGARARRRPHRHAAVGLRKDRRDRRHGRRLQRRAAAPKAAASPCPHRLLRCS